MQVVKGRFFYPIRPFKNLREMILQSGQIYGQLDAFRFRDDPSAEPRTKSYQSFIDDFQALGTVLLHLGFGGKRISVIGENAYNWSVTHTAVLNGVGVSVPLDRLLPEKEIIMLLERGGVSAVFYDASFHDIMLKACRQLPGQIKMLCCMRGKIGRSADPVAFSSVDLASPSILDDATQAPGIYRFEDLLAAGRALREQGNRAYDEAPIDENALASLLFTSGTTSTSKAVMLSHRNICSDVTGVAGIIKLKQGTRMLSILPLHHTFENTCGLFVALFFGCEIVICDGLRHIQKNLMEYHIDMIIGVPVVFESFYRKVQDSLKKSGKDKLVRKMIPVTEALRKVGIDLRRKLYKQIIEAFGGRLSLGICGAAPIDPEIIRFFDAVGFRILQGYGLTETAPVASGCNDKDFMPGTVGYPVAGVEIAVDTDQPGEPGEILVRGPIVMNGYYQDPAATAEAIGEDGWFHTGDIGVINPKNNYLSITGRLKSMIVLKSGKKVFPEELEFMINQNALIKESMVWGEENEEGDVVVNAKIVLDREHIEQEGVKPADEAALKMRLDQIIAEINRHLPSFKSIRNYVFSFQDMVKTTTLKIRRPIEIASIRSLMERSKLRWRELTGRNLDQLAEASASDGGQEDTEKQR
ncbi:MAG: AMP-binding protein [Clostridiales bacterium]|nr:AMP-binding protein [Clostridiales bacterium]MDD4019766.1 AMP-binding protein [Kiritimatiellia bacterium]